MIEEHINGYLKGLKRSAGYQQREGSCLLRTTMIKVLTIPPRIRSATSLVRRVSQRKASSSANKGNMRAAEKGQPTVAPIPNHVIPSLVNGSTRLSIKAAKPIMEVYMAKLEGR